MYAKDFFAKNKLQLNPGLCFVIMPFASKFDEAWAAIRDTVSYQRFNTNKIALYSNGSFDASKHKSSTLIFSSNGTYEKRESTIKFKVDQIWDVEKGYQAVESEVELFYEESGGELRVKGGSEKIWG